MRRISKISLVISVRRDLYDAKGYVGLYRQQNYSQSDIIPEMPGNTYGITGLQNGSAWGIRGVLEQLDPSNVMKLIRIVVKPYTIDRAQTIGDVQVTYQ